jgi:hypothetical protein
MPRATSYRRQEVRHLRRLAHRTLNSMVLDDDFVAPEMDWAEPPLVKKATGERDLQQWFVSLAADDLKDQ